MRRSWTSATIGLLLAFLGAMVLQGEDLATAKADTKRSLEYHKLLGRAVEAQAAYETFLQKESDFCKESSQVLNIAPNGRVVCMRTPPPPPLKEEKKEEKK